MTWIIVICMFIQFCGTYCIWPDRWNIPAHLSLSLFIVAFLVPCTLTDIVNQYPQDTVGTCIRILVLGSISYLAGMFAGRSGYRLFKAISIASIEEPGFGQISDQVTTRSFHWIMIGCFLMCLSFAGMGFVPALAKNALEAKFFRGDYAAGYQRVQIFYRTGMQITSLLIPLEMCIWLDTRKKRHLMMTLFGSLLLALGLTRGLAATGILIAIGIYISHRGRTLVTSYWATVVLLFALGSVSYYILFLFLGFQAGGYYDVSSVAAMMASGAPDLNDMLNFLSKFLANPEFTYGKTFVGGLIPSHFSWNPAVWTLHIVSPNTDLSEIVSGGLRLPLAIWGYVSFGWIGTVIVPFLSGFFQGGIIFYVRKCLAEARSNTHICLLLLVYMNLFVVFYNYYALLLYWIPQIFVLLMLIRTTHIKLSHRVPKVIQL